VNLTIDLRLVSRLRTRGTLRLLLDELHDVALKAQGQILPYTFTQLSIDLLR